MNNKTMLQRSLLTTGITLALGLSFGLSQNALADSASADLEVKAGLAQALTLSCDTGLSFGITSLGTLARTADTTISVAASDGSITVAGNLDGVTAGQGQAGSCTMSGSAMPDDSDVTVSVDGQTGKDIDKKASVALDGDGGAFTGLDVPTTALTNLTADDFEVDPVTPNVTSGGATFDIGATLTIPDTLNEDNLGGYQSTISISVDDGQT